MTVIQRQGGMPKNHRMIGALGTIGKLPVDTVADCFQWKNPSRTAEQAKQVVRTCMTNYSKHNWARYETRGHPTKFNAQHETMLCEKVNKMISQCRTSIQKKKWSARSLLRKILVDEGHPKLSSTFYDSFLKVRHPIGQDGLLFPQDFRKLQKRSLTAEVEISAFGEETLTRELLETVRCNDNGYNDGVVDFAGRSMPMISSCETDTSDVVDMPMISSCETDTSDVVESSADSSRVSDSVLSRFLLVDCDLGPFQPLETLENNGQIATLSDSGGFFSPEVELLLSFSNDIGDDDFFDAPFFEDLEHAIVGFVDPVFSLAQLNMETHLFRVYPHFGCSNLTLIEPTNSRNTFIGAVLYTLKMTLYFRSKVGKDFIDPLTLRNCVLNSLLNRPNEYISEYLKSGNDDYRLVYPSPLNERDLFEVTNDFISDIMRSGYDDQHKLIDVGRAATAKLMNLGNDKE
jgi:hypothetical protein